MSKAWISIGFGVLCACAPELSAGRGQRCDEALLCGEALECYRGYCVPEGRGPSGESIEEAEADSAIVDGERDERGTSTEQDRDAGPARSGSAPAASAQDAGAAGAKPTVDAGPADAGGKPAAPPPAVTSAPATGSPPASAAPDAGGAAPQSPVPRPPKDDKDAGSGGGDPVAPVDAGQVTPVAPVDAGQVAPVDAGRAVVDAGQVLPDAVAKKCTLEECCAEANRVLARDGADDNRGPGSGGKRCGCDDPQLLRTLTCVIVPPLSSLPLVPLL